MQAKQAFSLMLAIVSFVALCTEVADSKPLPIAMSDQKGKAPMGQRMQGEITEDWRQRNSREQAEQREEQEKKDPKKQKEKMKEDARKEAEDRYSGKGRWYQQSPKIDEKE